MTDKEFDALLALRDERRMAHDLACQIIAEEGENALTRHTCLRTYFELEDVEQQIAAEVAAERLEEEKARADYDPSPMCPCETCPVDGPFTCVRND